MLLKSIISSVAVFIISLSSYSQINEGGSPLSLQKIPSTQKAIFKYVPQTYLLPTPNVAAAKIEDIQNDPTGPYRVGLLIPVSIQMNNQGTWETLANGKRVWRLTIQAKNAKALGLYFDSEVQIPAGAKLFAYNENGKQVVGAFTSQTDGFQAMEMVQGEKLFLEYQAESWVNEEPTFHVNEISYFYRGVDNHLSAYSNESVEKAENCEVDVACSEGANWANQIKSVVHYTFNQSSSTYVCSASTINNTANDCKPYILTAWHCGERTAGSSIASWVWYWKYQKSTCSTGSGNQSDPGKGSSTMTGGQVRASSGNGTLNNPPSAYEVAGSDFYLVELNSQPPSSYNVYYAGWNRTNNAATSGVGIHHPAGSAKKISTYTSAVINSDFNGGTPNSHWGVLWTATTNGYGVTEGGSSGSPLFNQNGQIIGQLSGGGSACTVNGAGAGTGPGVRDVYGKMYLNWDQCGTTSNAQLKPWLDPNNIGATNIAGIAAPCATVNIPVAQFIANPTSLPISGTSQFTDQSTGSPTSWSWAITPATGWSYINATNANSQNPQVQFNVAGLYTVTLTVTNSAGSSTPLTKTNYIQVTAATTPCVATSTGCDEFIQQVVLESINNVSACNNYTSYNQTATLVKGNTYSISIIPQIQAQTPGTAYTGDEIAAWIDFNGNLSFADAGEQIAFVSIQSGSTLQWDFTVPLNAITGTVKLRTRMVYNGAGGDGPINPCGTSSFGEVEDYNISIVATQASLDANPLVAAYIYPNPTQDQVKIDLSAVVKDNISIDVLDLTGKIIYTYSDVISDVVELNLANLRAGSYQIRIANGTSLAIKKIVKL